MTVMQQLADVIAADAQALEAAAANTAPPLSPAETKRGEAAQLAGRGDLDGAIACLNEALTLEPTLTSARLDLAEIEMAADRFDAARAHLEAAEPKSEDRESALRLDALKARLVTLDAVKDLPATAELEAALAASPNDLRIRFDLAHAQIAEGDFETALEHLMTILQTDRKWNEEGARKAMINVFNLLSGNEEAHDLVSKYRRRLATALN